MSDVALKIGDFVIVPNLISIRMKIATIDKVREVATCVWDEEGIPKIQEIRIDALEKAPREATKKLRM